MTINIINVGKFTAEFPRVNAPLSIGRIMQSLPIKGRGIKQGDKIIMPTDLNIRPEKPRASFSAGNISIDPSSGNLTIHLRDGTTQKGENYLGSINKEFDINNVPISSGILIKEVTS